MCHMSGVTCQVSHVTWQVSCFRCHVSDVTCQVFGVMCHHFFIYIYIVTLDTWHVTQDTWHLTPDMWHVTHGWGWTFSQNFSSLALPVWDTQCLEDSERKDDLINQTITEVIVEQPRLHRVCLRLSKSQLSHLKQDILRLFWIRDCFEM